MNDSRVKGDFHIIRMDDLFHVVFRPDSDPEWFRIIATFFTYDRAYMYCDIERISSYEIWDERGGNSDTATEEHEGLRPAPVQIEPPAGWMGSFDGAPDLVRNICPEADKALPPQPAEDFSEHPNDGEDPKVFHDRQFQQAIAKEADKPTCAECGKPRHPSSGRLCRACYRVTPVEGEDPLTPNQTKVIKFFRSNANPLNLVSATYRRVADGSGILKTSASGVVESLERRGLVEVVERGKPGHECVFRLVVKNEAEAETAQ